MDSSPEATRKALQEALQKTFEAMAFMVVTPNADAPLTPSNTSEIWVAELPVQSPFSGTVALLCPQSLAEELTSFVYGLAGEAPEEAMIRDAMAEFVNTISGAFVAQIVSEKETFELGLPEVSRNWPTWFSTESQQIQHFSIDEIPLCTYYDGPPWRESP